MCNGSNRICLPSPAAIRERACAGDNTTSSFIPSTKVPYSQLTCNKAYSIYQTNPPFYRHHHPENEENSLIKIATFFTFRLVWLTDSFDKQFVHVYLLLN